MKRYEGKLYKKESKLFNSFADERLIALKEVMHIHTSNRLHCHALLFNAIVDAYKYGRKEERKKWKSVNTKN